MWLLASQHNARESGRVIQRFLKCECNEAIAGQYQEATAEYGGKYGWLSNSRAWNLVAPSPRNFGSRNVISWRCHEIRRARLAGALRSFPDIAR
jgi:hypothetical protein